jgi:EPS-associated MarR family transcriptional regulator
LSDEDLHLRVLRLLERDPALSQRQLARALGISVGKTHYALMAVLARGWVKAKNFRRSDNRKAYLYLLTSSGLSGKAQLALHLLQRKRLEHATLMAEIEQLQKEVQVNRSERP